MRSWLWVSLAACRKDEIEATLSPSPLVPTVGLVAINGPDGRAFVEYGLEGFDQRTPESEGGTHHELALLGLKAGRTYQWRAVVEDERGRRHESEPSTFETPLPPPGLLPLAVTTQSPEAETRFVLAAGILSQKTSFAAIYDRDGDWVWWVDTGGRLIVTPERSLDGKSVLFSQYDFAKLEDVGTLVQVSLDGRSRTETRLKMGHHDFVQHDDGTVAFLSLVFEDIDTNGESRKMTSDAISVGPLGMTEDDVPDLIWNTFDDLPLEPEPTCRHITSPDIELGGVEVNEWTHGNSLMYVPEDDAYYVNAKFTDWLYKVSRDGELQWILNGRGTDFRRPQGGPVWDDIDRTALWSHGHISDIWSGGGLMFDNGDHHPTPISSAMEFRWDEASRVAEVVWEFRHPGGRSMPTLGDVRRMPENNVLVTWSTLFEIDEVTPDKRVVWHGEPQGDLIVGRIVPIADLYGP